MYQAILLDIEGTTTPIDFVHKTLFPFAAERIGGYVRDNFGMINLEVRQLRAEYKMDFSDQLYGRSFDESEPESIAAYLEFLIEQDRKSTPLKSLQGKIWKAGYQSGELRSAVYEDVPRAFERWKSAGILIAIYSSGSVLAQRLLFTYSDQGDLTPFISDYFDTAIGAKSDSISYRRIGSSKGFPPVENSLFVSDVITELDAAKAAGFDTLFSIRKGNAMVEKGHAHKIIKSFDEIE